MNAMPRQPLPALQLPSLQLARWPWTGSLRLRLALVAALLVVVGGALAGWLVSRTADQETVRRLLVQQSDAVEVVARVLASKIEQNQKALRTVAAGITPDMLDSPARLQALLRQSLPAGQLFDFVQVAGRDGQLRVNLHYGRLDQPDNLDPAERDCLRRTLVRGKPMVSELIAGRTRDARVMFTMPLHRADGSVMGVVAGGLLLQSQALLPASMALPERDGARLVVFARDGTILLHSDAARTMGHVRSEPGLSQLYQEWTAQQSPVQERGQTQVLAQHIISVAGMSLPQWQVARVSDAQAVLSPLHSAQRQAAWLAAGAIGLLALVTALVVLWMGLPLARLRARAELLLLRPAASDAPPWPGGAGEVDALAHTFRATEALLAQQHAQLQTVQNQLAAVLEQSGIGIAVLLHGRMEVLGRHACQMLGYTETELKGRRVRELYYGSDDYAQTRARVRAGFAAHGVLAGEVRLKRKDGSPVWLSVQGRYVRSGERESGTLWMLQDLAASHEARQQHSWIATHDALTHLVNRAGCEQRLQALLAERRAATARRAGPAPQTHPSIPASGGRGTGDSTAAPGPVPVPDDDGVFLHLDLDHFAVLNGAAGQAAGDDVLCYVAQLLQAQVGQSGWVARLGGDTYGVLLPGCSAVHAAMVAEQLRRAVQAWEPAYQGRSFSLGASIGLVVLDARTHNAATVLQAADMACYRAKRAGRNRVHRHTPAPDAATATAAPLSLAWHPRTGKGRGAPDGDRPLP